MDKVTVTIDGITLEVPSNYTVLQACREAGIDIPTLCYAEVINEIGSLPPMRGRGRWRQEFTGILHLSGTEWYEHSYQYAPGQRSTQSKPGFNSFQS